MKKNNILLTITLVITLLTGCNNNGNENAADKTDIHDKIENINVPPSASFNSSEQCYTASMIMLPDDIDDVDKLVYNNDKLYFTSTTLIFEDESYNAQTLLTDIYSINPDGTELTKLVDFTHCITPQENVFGEITIDKMCIDDDGNLWVLEAWSLYLLNLPADFNSQKDEISQYLTDYASGNAIRKLKASGSELFRLNLAEYAEDEVGSIISLEVDSTGNFFVCTENYKTRSSTVYVFNNNGVLLSALSIDELNSKLVRIANGYVALLSDTTNATGGYERKLHMININKQTFNDTVSTAASPLWNGAVFSGGDYYSLLISDGRGLYAISAIKDDPAVLLEWSMSNVGTRNNIDNVMIITDERIACTVSGNIYILSIIPKDELPEPIILTVGVMHLGDELIDEIRTLDRDNYFINIEYRNYTEADKLTSDIITGSAPDIFVLSGLPYAQYAHKGVFANIYEFIDNDHELDRNDFVQSALRTLETDNKLFLISSCFGISAIAGNPSVIGIGNDWTLEEFETVLDTHPDADIPLGTYMTGSQFLLQMISANINEYIDWDTGIVRFNTPEFIRLLELSKKLPNNLQWLPEEEAIATGRQIMSFSGIGTFIMPNKMLFGDDFIYKGFPAESGSKYIITFSHGYAINEASQNKEAAWTFLHPLFTKDWQLDNVIGTLPINQAALDYKIQDALIDGNRAMYDTYMQWTHGSSRESTREDYALTQADADRIYTIIDLAQSDAYVSVGWELQDIIRETVVDYHDGLINTVRAAEIIQNRVEIYVSERR